MPKTSQNQARPGLDRPRSFRDDQHVLTWNPSRAVDPAATRHDSRVAALPTSQKHHQQAGKGKITDL